MDKNNSENMTDQENKEKKEDKKKRDPFLEIIEILKRYNEGTDPIPVTDVEY